MLPAIYLNGKSLLGAKVNVERWSMADLEQRSIGGRLNGGHIANLLCSVPNEMLRYVRGLSELSDLSIEFYLNLKKHSRRKVSPVEFSNRRRQRRHRRSCRFRSVCTQKLNGVIHIGSAPRMISNTSHDITKINIR